MGRVETLEDCDVRDDDEEHSAFHPNTHSNYKMTKGARLTHTGLATRGTLSLAKEFSSPDYKLSDRLQEQESLLRSGYMRGSSGQVSQKIVTNESIRPLPTSFALQNRDSINHDSATPLTANAAMNIQ